MMRQFNPIYWGVLSILKRIHNSLPGLNKRIIVLNCASMGKKITLRKGTMKLLGGIMILVTLHACQQKKISLNVQCKKMVIRTFTSESIMNWYYIRNINKPGEGGYYLESKKPVKNFKDASFIYYDMRPIVFNGQYLSGEKIILTDPKSLPENLQQSIAELESVNISGETSDK